MSEKKEKRYVSEKAQQRCKAGIRKTHQEFCDELRQLNLSIIPLEEYISAYTKIRFKCEKCGHEWITAPTNITNKKHGCPVCSRKRATMKRMKPHAVFIQEVNDINPNIEISTQYSGAHNYVECRCKICGHEWKGRPDHLRKGIGCPKCTGNATKNTDTFIEEMKKINPFIEILGQYSSADEKITCRCKICKHTWDVVPNSLLSGSGCPSCFKRYKTSFAEQGLLFYVKQYYPNAIGTYERDGFELDIYIEQIKTAIEYDGKVWHLNRLENDNKKDLFCVNNGIRLIRVREKGLTHTVLAENIFREGTTDRDLQDCINKLLNVLGIDKPEVDIERDRIHIINGYYTKLKGNSLLDLYPDLAAEWHTIKNENITPDMVYPNSGKKFWWKCSVCGFEWPASPDHRNRGQGCPQCKTESVRNANRKSHETFVQEVNELNLEITVLEKYVNSRTPLKCQCNRCNTIFFVTPHDILQGRSCPRCTKIKKSLGSRKTQEQFLDEMKILHPNLHALETYVTAKYPIKCECKVCGYIWETTPDRLRHGAGCPRCAGNARMSHDEFVNAVRKNNPHIQVVGQYKRSTEKIKYKGLQCGYEGEMRASHLKEGHGCPECAKLRRKSSKKEQEK